MQVAEAVARKFGEERSSKAHSYEEACGAGGRGAAGAEPLDPGGRRSGGGECRCAAAWPSQARWGGERQSLPFLFLREAWRRLPSILRELRGQPNSPFRRRIRVRKVGLGDPGLPQPAPARVTSEQGSAPRKPARGGPGGCGLRPRPRPSSPARGGWWRGGARWWAGRGNREERAGRVRSCPCLALERGRAGARAGGKPARAAVVGSGRRGGEVTCERAAAPVAAGSRRPRGAPHTLRGWGRGPGGVRGRSRRRGGGVAASAPPPAPGRVGAAGVGARRAAAGRGGEAKLCGPGPAAARGGRVGAGGGGRRHVGVCGKRGAPGRLPSGPALGLEPPRSRRARPRDAAPEA